MLLMETLSADNLKTSQGRRKKNSWSQAGNFLGGAYDQNQLIFSS